MLLIREEVSSFDTWLINFISELVYYTILKPENRDTIWGMTKPQSRFYLQWLLRLYISSAEII